jgi:ketosteroid isomerase-like protein
MALRCALLAFIAFSRIPAATAQEPSASPAESEAIRATVQGFKHALAAQDSVAALGYLHPDLIVFERGVAETLTEYRSGHLAGDMEYAAGVETTSLENGVSVRSDMALWVNRTESKGEVRGRAIESRGTETMVLLPTAGGWKIVHIHWSTR